MKKMIANTYPLMTELENLVSPKTAIFKKGGFFKALNSAFQEGNRPDLSVFLKVVVNCADESVFPLLEQLLITYLPTQNESEPVNFYATRSNIGKVGAEDRQKDLDVLQKVVSGVLKMKGEAGLNTPIMGMLLGLVASNSGTAFARTVSPEKHLNATLNTEELAQFDDPIESVSPEADVKKLIDHALVCFGPELTTALLKKLGATETDGAFDLVPLWTQSSEQLHKYRNNSIRDGVIVLCKLLKSLEIESDPIQKLNFSVM